MRLGLRPQLLLIVTLLLGLALVPLFWTASTISRVSLERAEFRTALVLSRSLAQSVARGGLMPSLGDPVVGCTLITNGSEVVHGAPVPSSARSAAMAAGYEVHSGSQRIIWSWARDHDRVAYVGVTIDTAPHETRSFLGLLALYIGLLGLALLLAIHLAVTLLIVRPLDALGRAARRVAFGARELEIPRLPATELVSLGNSLRTMTEKLLADERELRAQIEEVHRANERLKEAQQRLIRSERLASVGRLAAGLAHELGNPIAAMLGLEALLLEGGLGGEEQKDFLRRIQRETERVHRILRDLLDFARPARQVEADASAEPGDVALGITETLALIQPQKAFKQLTLESKVDAALPLVALARPKLVQVLLNLLLNAADALAEQTPGNILVTATASARGGVLLAVADDGPGVATSIRDRLFEPFVTTKDVGKGTGLGLAVCRGLVESVGGNIHLDPSPAKGARFVVELPRYVESEEP